MSIRQAQLEETSLVNDLLKETAEWLQQKGSDQWSEVLAGDDKHGLSEAVKKGEVYFFYNKKQELAGMFALWKNPSKWDRELWRENDFTKESLYLHRLIIRPKFRGKNYGSLLLEEIQKTFEKKANDIRLDCLASNKRLIEFYKKNRFKQVGSQEDGSGIHFVLFRYSFEVEINDQ